MPSSPVTVLYTDHGFASTAIEEKIISQAGATLIQGQYRSEADLLPHVDQVHALLVQWAPITARVIAALENCRVIVRMGIGVDNVDLEAAEKHGIAVCNVPDYCINEVADHTLGLALCLARQLSVTHERVRQNEWRIVPKRKMPAFQDMVFATIGYGRIAQQVLSRARGFGFTVAAHDPLVPDATLLQEQVRPLTLNSAFKTADIISLHCPLSDDTHHLVNAERLAQMKLHAILINTSRGALIDTRALASALQADQLGGAGLDVFEDEPLPPDHPIRNCPNVLLTSHMAWYSERSVPALQRLAAEEVVRGLQKAPLRNPVVPYPKS